MNAITMPGAELYERPLVREERGRDAEAHLRPNRGFQSLGMRSASSRRDTAVEDVEEERVDDEGLLRGSPGAPWPTRSTDGVEAAEDARESVIIWQEKEWSLLRSSFFRVRPFGSRLCLY